MFAGLLLCGHNLQYDHKARFGDPRKDVTAKVSPNPFRISLALMLRHFVAIQSCNATLAGVYQCREGD